MKSIFIPLLFIFYFCTAISANAASVKAGIKALQAKQYEVALTEIQPLAEDGDPFAQFLYGIMHRNGHGVEKDFKKAAVWFELAAKKDVTPAQYELGSLYAAGKGVPEDLDLAKYWLEKASAKGFKGAKKKLELISKLRISNNEAEQNKENPSPAVKATEPSAPTFNDGIEAVKRKEFAKAITIFTPFAENGHSYAQTILGIMYQTGEGTPKNYAKAEKWYRLAAEQGEVKAQRSLGIMYHKGQGVSKDYAKAEKWYRLAAEQDDPKAQGYLAALELDVAKEDQRIAIEQRDVLLTLAKGAEAWRLGDFANALEIFTPLAKSGNPRAQLYIGIMHNDGNGVPQDRTEATRWFRLAAEQGHKPAIEMLDKLE